MKSELLIEMLRWKRPSGSFAAKMFGEKYLKPTFGEADASGNYTLIIPKGEDNPNLCFTAHYDTVHSEGGFQEVSVENGIAFVEDSDCLGADCTTGIWLILGMIEAGIPGVYVVHADEEVGCLGSQDLVRSMPPWLTHIDAVISFDRFGEDSVITHQMGSRTASDAFAESLADALNLPMMPDPYGSFTDSNEYVYDVSECTNLSVGYYKQHTSSETQDLVFAERLLLALLDADFSNLVFQRPKGLDPFKPYSNYYGNSYRDGDYRDTSSLDALRILVEDNTLEVAEWLHSAGVTPQELAEEARIEVPGYLIYEMTKDAL